MGKHKLSSRIQHRLHPLGEMGWNASQRCISPTAAKRSELSDEYSAVDAESQNILSLKRAFSLSHHVDAEVADNGNWYDLVGAHSDG